MVDRLDETLLTAIHSLLQTYEQKKEDLQANLLKEELLKEVEVAEKGHFITIEELEKKSKQWLSVRS